MALSILVALIAAPALLGSQEAIRQSQSQEKREEHRARRCNLIASCTKASQHSREIDGRPIVLRNGKLWIDVGSSDGEALGHPYAGYYLPYPDTKYEGLVTTITDVAPIMNWVYIDKETHEARYGVRVDAQPNLTGPFDCTRQDRRLTFDGWEGWCAVEEIPGYWSLFFDVDDDGLRSKVAPGTRVLEIELTRKEKRWKKDSEERQKDQTTKRKVDAKQDTPTDDPVTSTPSVDPNLGVSASTEEEKAEVAPPPLKPFSLPKSIFSDPPRPIFSDAFGRFADAEEEKVIVLSSPPSPPPAYSPLEVKTPVDRAPITPPQTRQPSRNPSPNTGNAEGSKSVQRIISQLQPSPEFTSSALNPAPLRSGETPPKSSSPPKLNRNSGSRALAQAQMFEALAAGKTSKNTAPSRPISARTSSTASDYENPIRTGITEIFDLYDRPLSNDAAPSMPPLPSSLEIQQQPEEDPAVFGATDQGKSKRGDGNRSRASVSKTTTTPSRRNAPPRRSSATTPTNQPSTDRPENRRTRAPSSASDTRNRSGSISGAGRSLTSRGKTPVRSNTERRSNNDTYASPSRSRISDSTPPRTVPRSNRSSVSSTSRSNLSTTMTSGAVNRGMTSRTMPKAPVDGTPRSQLKRAATSRESVRDMDESGRRIVRNGNERVRRGDGA